MKKQKVILAAIAAVSAASLTHAAIITSVETGSADWDTPSAWSNGEAPSAANDYVGGSGVRVNSPNGGTFAGNSLTLEGSVNFQVGSSDPANVVVINDLRMNGGTFRLRFDVASTGSYGVLQGNMAIQAATTLDTWFGGERSLEIQSLISGSEAVTINARNTPEFFRFTNAGNTYSGTWNIAAGLAEFSSAGAVGVGSSFVVESGATLRVDESFIGDSMSVTNGAVVEVNTGVTYFLTSLTANGSPVTTGSYSVVELNTEIGSTIFSGAGDIVIDSELAAKLPQFVADPIVTAYATNGVDYAALGQTLAGSATNDFGDTMSYEKVGGPAWLVVATNGVLSGTPTATGTDVFTIKATTGIYSSLGTLQIEVAPVGSAPVLAPDPIVKVDGVYGEDYALQSQSLTNNASDPDADDLTFALDGSGWLNVATNGDLSGVPDTYGTNAFTVTVDDGNGNTDTAQLLIYIPPPAPVAPSVDAVHRWNFDEATGTTAADTGTGTAADGVLYGGATWTNGTGNRATYLSFDGEAATYVDPSLTLPLVTETTDFTWTVWAKADVEGLNEVILGNRFDGTGTGSDTTPREFLKLTPRRAEFRPQDTSENTDFADLVVGEWTHLAVVKSGTNVTTYVNGLPDSSGSVASDFVNALPFFIGGDNGAPISGAESFEGGIDDVRIYDYALDIAEITYVKDDDGTVESPVMEITGVSGGNLTIEWDGTGFKLQTRQNLVVGGSWADYPGNPQSPATVPATNDVEFLRLIEQ